MFGHKTIYKVTNLKVHSKWRYFVFFFLNPFSRTTSKSSFGLQSCFPVFVTSQIVNPAYWNSTGWQVGRMFGWALHVSKSKPSAGVLYHRISDGNQLFSENLGGNFHFILHKMSDEAAFGSGAVLCTVLPRKPRSLPLQQRLPLAEN